MIGNGRLRILLVEPFFGGSHRLWAEGFRNSSLHEITVLSLPGRHWKWRMHGAAVSLAEQFLAMEFQPDLIIASDMLDLSTFSALTRKRTANVPMAVYFHENQITYPWSDSDSDVQQKRDNHYGFINYTSALTADRALFNSHYHRDSFLNALPGFLNQFPDHTNPSTIGQIIAKSEVLPLGMDLSALKDLATDRNERPNRAVILWNHRWEYDKNPEKFFRSLFTIQDRGWDFKLIVLGEKFSHSPKIFDEAKKRLSDHILHWGYAPSRAEYARLLHLADILPVTSDQDFFGGSVVEAMFCNVKPLLPKRLAYAEHVPANLHHAFFYDEAELTDRLQRWIKDISVLRKQQTRSFVEQYDWPNCIARYDAMMESMVR